MNTHPTDQNSNAKSATNWESLSPEIQADLLEQYGHYLDSLPPTCSLLEKNVRFMRWLAERGIRYHP